MSSRKKPHIPDQRTIAFHQKAADILIQHPERLADIHQVLDNWLKLEDTQAEEWAKKWKQIIDGLSAKEVAKLILEEGELADFYRKSSPFPTLLSESDRLEIINKYRFEYEKGAPGTHS